MPPAPAGAASASAMQLRRTTRPGRTCRAPTAASRRPRASRPSRASCPAPRGRTRAPAPADRAGTRAGPRRRRPRCRARARPGPGRSTPTPSAAAAQSPAPAATGTPAAVSARDLGRLQRARHPRLRHLQRLQHGRREAALGDVEQQRAGGVGDVDRALAAEPQAHVVLGQQHVADARVDARARAVRSHSSFGAVKPVSARLPVSEISRSRPTRSLDLGALGRRALVVPEDGRPQDALVLVERHQAVHLAREADARDLVATERGDRRLAARPPVLRAPAPTSPAAAARGRSDSRRARRPSRRPPPRAP